MLQACVSTQRTTNNINSVNVLCVCIPVCPVHRFSCPFDVYKLFTWTEKMWNPLFLILHTFAWRSSFVGCPNSHRPFLHVATVLKATMRERVETNHQHQKSNIVRICGRKFVLTPFRFVLSTAYFTCLLSHTSAGKTLCFPSIITKKQGTNYK